MQSERLPPTSSPGPSLSALRPAVQEEEKTQVPGSGANVAAASSSYLQVHATDGGAAPANGPLRYATPRAPGTPIPANDLHLLLRHAAAAAWKTFAFHGTKSSRVEGPGGIAATGLDPNYGGTGAAKGSSEFEEQSKQKVHYTRDIYHAREYQDYFEGRSAFSGQTYPQEQQGPAEILQLSLPASVAGSEQRDVSDKQGITTNQAIPPENVRRLKPADPPATKQEGELMWRQHQLKGLGSLIALKSNMAPEGQQLLSELVRLGSKESELLQMVKQALMANPADKFLPPAEANLNRNWYKSDRGATGHPLPPK